MRHNGDTFGFTAVGISYVLDMIVKHEENIGRLLRSIASRGTEAGKLAALLRTPAIRATFNKWDHNSWCISVAGDALVRVRQIVEQNFHAVVTTVVLATARYIFELSVWLRLFQLDSRYGLVYFDELLQIQERYYRDTKAHLRREKSLLESFADRENERQGRALEDFKASPVTEPDPTRLASTLQAISDDVDAEAARHFSIYADAARTNGYGFQAHLIETKVLPTVEKALADIADEREAFEATVAPEIKALRPSRWQWRSMADKVGAVSEYDYIYSFASKLLHAILVSITTKRKNLEPDEMEVFLKYIDVTIADILTVGRNYAHEHNAG